MGADAVEQDVVKPSHPASNYSVTVSCLLQNGTHSEEKWNNLLRRRLGK